MHKTKITIRGIVQNVGLRVHIKAVADGLGVCGTVENTRDGSVLVVCEAERADIEEMVRQIRSGAELAVIKDMLVEDGPPATGMEGFEIVWGDSGEELFSAISTGTRAVVKLLTTTNEIKQGQAQTNETLARMERGQARLEKGQAQTNETLARMERGQARLEKGQAQTNETLARMERGQARLEKGQAQTNETLARMEQGQEDLRRGQAETKDVIKSMDGKLDASLENDAQSLEILRDLRDGGLLRVP